MSLHTLPAELQTEILFQIVFAHTQLYHFDHVVNLAVVPYIMANRRALERWRADRRVILHRVATIHLNASAERRRRLRREMVLARLRLCVWRAAGADNNSARFQDARTAWIAADNLWWSHELIANHWRSFVLS
jgi:hypothetical protein